jgi:tetratricopeptide (TPR) repeat protein
MGLFNWLQNKNASEIQKKSDIDSSKKIDKIKVYDKYGREFFITRQEWKDKILIGNLEKVKTNPDELYNALVAALQDDFFEDVIKYAEILHKIDPIKSRGAIILGIVYMKCNRLNDAEQVLTDFLRTNDEDGIVLTNLAKVYSAKKDDQKAESILWHALEVDPNQDNGLSWYTAIKKERDGEQGLIEAFKRVAALPKSWRAQLWLARFALQEKNIENAKKLYKESISRAGNPVPADLLMQMSGDLGNNGYLKEIIQLTQPSFDASFHGIMVGNNLIKTYSELGQLDEAQRILDQLYTQKRPDWRDNLSYWDTELAKKRIAIKGKADTASNSATIFSIEAPLWCSNSAFASLLPVKDHAAIKVFFVGSTVIYQSSVDTAGIQLTDGPGRASRAIPLFLSEKITLTTNADGRILIPWIQSNGFAVFGKAHEEKALCEISEKSDTVPDFIFSIVVDATQNIWQISANIIRRIDRLPIEKITINAPSENPGPAILELSNSVITLLTKHAGVKIISPPDWYVVPDGASASNYLLRLEQQLAVTCKNQDFLQGGDLNGEHEIIEGIIFLNLEYPYNKTVRMILTQTLKQMKKYDPNIVGAYKEKIMLLQKEHTLDGYVGQLISKTISEMI